MLSVAEAARRLRVSRATVYKLVAKGRLVHVRIGNQIRFLPGCLSLSGGLHKDKPEV